MTINWLLSTVDQTMSSRTSIEKKRWELASDMNYYHVKEVFRVMMLYFAQYDHSTPLAQFRLYRKIVSPDKLDRFLPTTKKIRARYVTTQTGSDGVEVETPKKKFINCCAKCVKLFKQVLDKKIDEKKCLKELMGDSYQQCKEIKKEASGRWFWESSWDTVVDTLSTSKVPCDDDKTFDDEVNNKRLELTAELCKTFDRLKAKQSIVWELHTPSSQSESVEENAYPWANHTVHVESQFDLSPPVGIRLIVTAESSETNVSAQVKIHQAENHLVVTSFKMNPMTNDKDPDNHIAEGVVYKLLAEILHQRSEKFQYVVFSDSEQVQAHDYVAKHYGLTPPNDRVLEKLGYYFAHEWKLSKDCGQIIMDNSPALLECNCLDSLEGMKVTLKLDTDNEPKLAELTMKRDAEKLVITSMNVEPPIVEPAIDKSSNNSPGSRMEGVVYQFVAELLLQKLGGCQTAIFPHHPDVQLHGAIAGEHGLIPPDKEKNDGVIAWTMPLKVAKDLAGGRVTATTETGSVQFF